MPEGLTAAERRELCRQATLAARERWTELVADERGKEIEANQNEIEARAASLEAQLQRSLPPDVGVGRDGSRVFLTLPDAEPAERTISSLSDAWLVLNDWQEQRRAAS